MASEIDTSTIVLTASDYAEYGCCFDEGNVPIRVDEVEEPRTLITDLQRVSASIDMKWVQYYRPFMAQCMLLIVATIVLSMVIE